MYTAYIITRTNISLFIDLFIENTDRLEGIYPLHKGCLRSP